MDCEPARLVPIATCRLYERACGLEEDQMKTVRILRFGPPNVITNDDLPRPEPAAGQLLVRVKAAGVGNWDALVREGKIPNEPLPLILGYELSGIVEGLGAQVSGFS